MLYIYKCFHNNILFKYGSLINNLIHMEDEYRKNLINQEIASLTPLGSLTLIGSLIALHVHDYLKDRESKEIEA